MSQLRAEKINEAVQNCLARCYLSQAPLATLAEFLHELQADDTWQPNEIRVVEATVQRVLKNLFSEPDDDILAS
jgi:hypothetical protein